MKIATTSVNCIYWFGHVCREDSNTSKYFNINNICRCTPILVKI